MTIKKFILGATVCASLFALTVPSTFVFASECQKDGGCPLSKVNPCNATCNKCHLPQDKCGCNDPVVTGGAASVKEENRYKQQMYSYPSDVYSRANTSNVGDANNGVIIGDDYSKNSNGILLQEGGMTGGAAMVDDTRAVDELITKKSPCAAPCDVSIESQTSIEMTRKYLEDYKAPKGFMTGAAAGARAFYPDVPDSFWASPEINRLTDTCVLAGYPDGLFKPTKAVSRAEMATAVVKGYNLENTAITDAGNFPDVPSTHWAYEMINKSATTDMVEGHANGKFDPNGSISVAQALTIVSKGINCPMDAQKADEILSQYVDGNQVPSWARMSVAKAIDNGAFKNGRNGKYIHPNKNASRAEVANMLQNIRIAGGYDVENKVAQNSVVKTFLEKEEKIQIPTLELKMNDIINSKNANVGDQFAATTVNPIIIDGVNYPAGSRVNGKVVEVIRPTKTSEGALRLSFNHIMDKEGENKMMLPKQVLTAQVDKTENVNGFARAIEMPFTWTGAVIGNVGRTAGGMVIGAANAAENVLDGTGTGTAELMTGKFRAAGRSYQDAGKALVIAPVDFTRTALSGTLGTFQTTADEIAYLVDPNGMKISQINPKQKLTIAFGE